MYIYICMIIITVVCAYYAERKNSKICLFITFALPTLFAAIRGENVGIDTKNYYSTFNNILQGNYVYSNDIFFLPLVKFLLKYLHSSSSIIFILSFFTNILFIKRFWELKGKSSFSFMLFCYLSCYFPESMNVMRQFLSLAIIFYATKYLKKKDYIIFVISVGIAFIFHTSAVLGMAVLIVHLFIEKRKRKERKLLILFFLLIIAGTIKYFPLFKRNYSHYFNDLSINLGLMLAFKMIFIILIYMTSNYNMKNNLFSFSSDYSKIVGINVLAKNCYIIGVLIYSLGMFFPYMDRVGLYFMIFEIPFLGQIIRYKIRTERYFYTALAIIIVLYNLYTTLTFDGQGIFPYTTIFD